MSVYPGKVIKKYLGLIDINIIRIINLKHEDYDVETVRRKIEKVLT
jgi:hypothetical protein